MATVWGAAFGDPNATHITIEDTNGLRIMNGSTVKLHLDTSGNATFAAGQVVISDAAGIEINAGASAVNPAYGFTWGTAFSGSNNIGVFAFETGGNARSLYLYNVTTQATSYADAVLFASANGSTSAVFSAVDDHRSGADTYLEASVVLRPSADNTWNLGSTSKRWATLYVANIAFDSGSSVSIEEDLAGRIRIGGTTSGTTAYLGWDGVNFIPFNDGTKHLGVGSFRWADVYAVNGTIQTSDEREKRDIAPLALGTDFLMSLRPVSYRWINEAHGAGLRHGFIAQEIPIDFGGLSRPDDSPWGLDYAQFIAPIVAGFQDLARRVGALETAKE